ncbi:hypothetical protein GGR57DRAFT_491129 [Xylariaceae sp. FL1272]|nr:hypothetical protein GGR57DRAFT_491129 [Xylariaceae sp. FL1272]
MPSPVVIKLAVSPPLIKPSTPSNKRKVTPSAELSSSKRALIVTTPHRRPSTVGTQVLLHDFPIPRQLFPDKLGTLSRDYSHARPPSQSHPREKETWHDRHIVLPFNLRDLSVSLENDEVSTLLYQVFPKTANVTETISRSHLIFQVDELPSTPWPQTIGGLPFTISDIGGDGRAVIFPRQIIGNTNISICEKEFNTASCGDRALRDLGAAVSSSFAKCLPSIRPLELMFTIEHRFYIVLEDHIAIYAVLSKLPGKIARRPVGYINNRELCRPMWADLPAKRYIEPQPVHGVIDASLYDTLRPGVLISSKLNKEHAHPVTFTTTSGILVQDRLGNRFMTGASHGIAADGNLSFTDICLVRLTDDVTFMNKTFDDSSGNVPSFVRLASDHDHSRWDICFLNSPFTGNMEAEVVGKSVKMEKSTHSTEDQMRYIAYSWAYTGQVEGNNDKIRPPNGFSVSVSASEVTNAGYSLVQE